MGLDGRVQEVSVISCLSSRTDMGQIRSDASDTSDTIGGFLCPSRECSGVLYVVLDVAITAKAIDH